MQGWPGITLLHQSEAAHGSVQFSHSESAEGRRVSGTTSTVELGRNRKASSFVQDNSELTQHLIGHTWEMLPDIFKIARRIIFQLH